MTSLDVTSGSCSSNYLRRSVDKEALTDNGRSGSWQPTWNYIDNQLELFSIDKYVTIFEDTAYNGETKKSLVKILYPKSPTADMT